jgi:hypothetical protein
VVLLLVKRGSLGGIKREVCARFGFDARINGMLRGEAATLISQNTHLGATKGLLVCGREFLCFNKFVRYFSEKETRFFASAGVFGDSHRALGEEKSIF